MTDEIRLRDIRELIFEYGSDNDSDIFILGDGDVPYDVFYDRPRGEGESENKLSLSIHFFTPETLVNRDVG